MGARVLVISPLDPSGRTGLLADVAAVQRAGAEPVACATALSAQPLHGDTSLFPVKVDALVRQLETVMAEGTFAAVKLGAFVHPDLVLPTIDRLMRSPPGPIVVEVALQSPSGAPLLVGGSRRAIYRELARLRPFFLCNQASLGVLSGAGASADEGAESRQMEQLLAWGASGVLLSGSHRPRDPYDLFLGADGQELRFTGNRVACTAVGKGARLSASLAGYLAQQVPFGRAVERSRSAVLEWLRTAQGS